MLQTTTPSHLGTAGVRTSALPVVGVSNSLQPLCALGSNGDIVDRHTTNGDVGNHNNNGFLPATTVALSFDSK
jgi:hypothetical protein